MVLSQIFITHRFWRQHDSCLAAIASQLSQLIENKTLRLALTKQGRDFVSQFIWQRAIETMEYVLINTKDADVL
jgi:hypothetical protein